MRLLVRVASKSLQTCPLYLAPPSALRIPVRRYAVSFREIQQTVIHLQFTPSAPPDPAKSEIEHRLDPVSKIVGDRVRMGDTIGYVETTYRIRTPIKAPCDGIIQQAEFEQGEMIEEGDGLFVIQPREDDGSAGAWGSNRYNEDDKTEEEIMRALRYDEENEDDDEYDRRRSAFDREDDDNVDIDEGEDDARLNENDDDLYPLTEEEYEMGRRLEEHARLETGLPPLQDDDGKYDPDRERREMQDPPSSSGAEDSSSGSLEMDGGREAMLAEEEAEEQRERESGWRELADEEVEWGGAMETGSGEGDKSSGKVKGEAKGPSIREKVAQVDGKEQKNK